MMRYEVVRDREHPDVWHVEAWDMAGDGDLHGAMFYGTNARQRAEEYARSKNQ